MGMSQKLGKTNNFEKFQKHFAVQLCEYFKTKRTFCETKFFLSSTTFPSLHNMGTAPHTKIYIVNSASSFIISYMSLTF